jgi:NTP pyrophosphatase (non-canonical NTP hydrolase)
MTSVLTFGALRAANRARLPEFKNRRGEPAHSQPDGSDWSPGEWMNAILGELGEAANIIKKVHRGDLTMKQARQALADEFADVVTYLDITAMQCGIDLGDATIDKFNRVSERVESGVRLTGTGGAYQIPPVFVAEPAKRKPRRKPSRRRTAKR